MMMQEKSLVAWFSLLALVVVVLTAGVSTAEAQTYYVRAGAGGSGTDWTNAYSALPATLVRGATYYVGAGTYSGYTFDDPTSGSSIITVKKATASDHGTNTGWQAGYANQAVFRGTISFTTSYYTFDGQVRNADWRSGYGFKVDVSQLGGSYGVTMGVPFQTAVQNITVRYVDVHGTGSDPDINSPDPINDRGITASCSSSCVGSSNLYVGYSYVHESGESSMHMFRSQNLTVEYTWIARNNSTAQHHAGGIIVNEGVNNFTFRHNVMQDIEGTAYIETPSGGHPGCSGSSQSNWYIYGNVFLNSPGSGKGTGNGVFYVFDHNHTGDLVFSNNSIVNMPNGFVGFESSPTSAGCASSMRVQNNVWYASQTPIARTANVGSLTWTHNSYFSTSTSDSDGNRQVASGSPFVDWQGYDFRLTNATSPGVALSAPYNTDLTGAIRGSDGVWDRGAFERGGSTSSGSAPSAPSNLRIVSQ